MTTTRYSQGNSHTINTLLVSIIVGPFGYPIRIKVELSSSHAQNIAGRDQAGTGGRQNSTKVNSGQWSAPSSNSKGEGAHKPSPSSPRGHHLKFGGVSYPKKVGVAMHLQGKEPLVWFLRNDSVLAPGRHG